MTPIVDAHVHLWDVERMSIPWFRDDLRLPRSVTASELRGALAETDVRSVLAVQAADTLGEARWLLSEVSSLPASRVVLQYEPHDQEWSGATGAAIEESGGRVAGMRVAAPAARADLADVPHLERLAEGLAETGRVMEVLIRAEQLPAVRRLAERHPSLAIVVCHLGLGWAEPTRRWRDDLRSLVDLPAVVAKFSGVARTPGDTRRLRSLFADAEAAVGVDRLMFGSDWPMSSRVLPYRDLIRLTAEAVGELDAVGARAFWSGTAARTYSLASS